MRTTLLLSSLVALVAGCGTSTTATVDSGSMNDAASAADSNADCVSDAGVDAGVTAGCPCSEPGRIVCWRPSDFVCAGGMWVPTFDACGEMDANVGHDAGTMLDTGSTLDGGSIGDGVECLGVPSGSCAAGQVCCGGSAAITCESSAATCSGEALACDGTEDCQAGTMCCSDVGGSMCTTTCSGYHLCHDATECGAGESCCPNGGGVPLGTLSHCLALAAGTSCPLPP